MNDYRGAHLKATKARTAAGAENLRGGAEKQSHLRAIHYRRHALLPRVIIFARHSITGQLQN